MKRAWYHLHALLLITLASTAVALSPPPDYEELTLEEMATLSFDYEATKTEELTYFQLRFPKTLQRIHKLAPHVAEVVLKTADGQVVSRSKMWINGNEYRAIDSSYDHRSFDLSVSVTYACPTETLSDCHGATELGISSVSGLISASGAAGLPPQS